MSLNCIKSNLRTEQKHENGLTRVRSFEKEAQENGKRLGLDGDPDLQFLLGGESLVKIRSSSWKRRRKYKLKEDCKTMWHESKKIFRRKQTFSLYDVDSEKLGPDGGGSRKSKQWVNSLEKVMKNLNNLSPQQKSEHWLISCMHEADKNHDDKMTLDELKNFLQRINIGVSDIHAEALFKECDKSKTGALEDSEIKLFYDRLTQRQEINMSVGDLQNFLLEEQVEQATTDDALRLIEKYERDETAKKQKRMTKDGFLMYLQGEEGSILNPKHKEVYQDMTQPLSHYYISSSHNTYLQGHQISGPSSVEAYINVLMKGCRCVELDCYDGPDEEPEVYHACHGAALTSKVLFKDVITVIKKYAFKTSQYPVILSLENHCSMSTSFPSPQELKGKFLVKGKRYKVDTSFIGPEDEDEDSGVSEEDEAAEVKAKGQIEGQVQGRSRSRWKGRSRSRTRKGRFRGRSRKGRFRGRSRKGRFGGRLKGRTRSTGRLKSSLGSRFVNYIIYRAKMKLAKKFSDIIVYCHSVHFHSFKHAKDNHSFYEMPSITESKAFDLAKTSGTDFMHHNMEKLCRIYPEWSRMNSSNYNPVPMWNVGCQIVALNFQTPCTEMDLYQGRFLPNGSCGYILKPEFLRDPDSQFDPKGPWLKKKTLHIMVISAQQLPKVNKEKLNSIVDPLVRMEIYGVPEDIMSQETEYILDNGFNPSWNKKFEFPIHVPELAMLRFVVEDYDQYSSNDFVGQFCLPLSSVQNGFRHVPLLTETGDLIPCARLFVHLMLVDD
ncbi:hypothetical protein WMY93_006184 [Mugilogobius chulae]|uniref:Phosphoinositide phospholipase C n=1 Tax=Mugilogobius chulae TaxID=88201 RepID=A0AAW0PMA4_9GOBI